MHTRSQTRAMDFDERIDYERQFEAQLGRVDQPIKCTLLDGREFTFEDCYETWIDIRYGQREYDPCRFFGLAHEIAQKTGIPEDDQILFNTDTGERLNDAYYEGRFPGWDGLIPRDLANVLVMTE